jgi:hypothetical protein
VNGTTVQTFDEIVASLPREQAVSLLAKRVGLLTREDVMQILSVSYGWLRDHTVNGKRPKLPHVRLGSMLRFRVEDLDRFIQDNCQ